MGILSSYKFGIEEGNLQIKFDSECQKYIVCLPDGTPALSLSSNLKKIVDKKNAELLNNPSLLNAEMKSSAEISRYNKLKELGFPCHSFETLYSSRKTDMMSDEIAQYLKALTSEKNVLIGIHRTGNASLDDIEKILKRGLVMTMLGGNTMKSSIHLMNNVSYYPDNETIIKELINADEYKRSLGSILIRIPDEDLSRNIFMIDTESGEVVLDPLYIIGFVPVGVDGYISEIITPYPPRTGAPFKGLEALYDEREYARDELATNNLKK